MCARFADHAAHVAETAAVTNDPDPLGALDAIIDRYRRVDPNSDILIALSYELGAAIEPAAKWSGTTERAAPSGFPLIVAQRLSSTPLPTPTAAGVAPGSWRIDPASVALVDPGWYTSRVERTLERIAAGDIYQANIAHPIRTGFAGSARAFAAHMIARAAPTLGAFTVFDLEQTRHAVVSLSPELFLQYDASSRRLVTEPMKGTRPAGTDPDELRDAPKDRAELNMIIDLMRNDLGRIAEPGSVKVEDPRVIGAMGSGVLQAWGRVSCTARPDKTRTNILRAAFPPGSITGAPKIRAMQIIDELERSDRGPYCGSTILLRPDGSFTASVNIRTVHLFGEPDPGCPESFASATLHYRTGAGIVADSDPNEEWDETLAKAGVLLRAIEDQKGLDSGPGSELGSEPVS